MSKLFLIICKGKTYDKVYLNQIRGQFEQHGLFVFFNQEYNEPFLDELQLTSSDLLCGISDDRSYVNCEMLLLPDLCSYNGKNNSMAFREKMNMIQCILESMSKEEVQLELFVCDSGACLEDFLHYTTTVECFSEVASCLNSIAPPDLRLSFV